MVGLFNCMNSTRTRDSEKSFCCFMFLKDIIKDYVLWFLCFCDLTKQRKGPSLSACCVWCCEGLFAWVSSILMGYKWIYSLYEYILSLWAPSLCEIPMLFQTLSISHSPTSSILYSHIYQIIYISKNILVVIYKCLSESEENNFTS